MAPLIIEKDTGLAKNIWSSSVLTHMCVIWQPYLQRRIGTATFKAKESNLTTWLTRDVMVFVLEVACADHSVCHCAGWCRHDPWKCYYLDDTENLDREKAVWFPFTAPGISRVGVLSASPYQFRVFSLKFLHSWAETIDTTVLQNGVT